VSLAIGIDIGGTKVAAGVVDESGRLLAQARRRTPSRDPEHLVDVVVEIVGQLRSEHVVSAVGVGAAGFVDAARSTVLFAPNLAWRDAPLRDEIAARIDLPVVVENDANAAAWGEYRFGAGEQQPDLVVLTIGTGIGGGLVIGGEVFRGAIGSGAELGHMVVEIDGPPCQGSCPSHGCLEAVASGTALAREGLAAAQTAPPHSPLARALADGREITGVLVTELALEGDPTAQAVIALIGRRLGVGISNLVNIFNPEVVVVGGGVIAAGELLLGPARAEVAARALRPSRDVVRILPAHFGAEAGLLGAAALAWEGLGEPATPPPADPAEVRPLTPAEAT
jgi:glucokinase